MMHVILICFDRTKKERQLIVSPIMKGRIDMTKPWDPDVELSILVSETQAYTMTHILKTVKPFFDRAGVADFCDRAIKDFEMMGEFLREKNREAGIDESDLVPECDPVDHHSPGPGDWFVGHCGSVVVNMGELLMVELAPRFLTEDQKKALGERRRESFSDVEEFMGYDVMQLYHDKPDNADFKDSEKYWALCDVYDEEHPENVEEREQAEKEFLEDKAWWESYQRGEDSTAEVVEEEDEDEY